MKLAHIIPDEKFIKDCQVLFDGLAHSDWFFIAENSDINIKYINDIFYKKVFLNQVHSFFFKEFDAVIFHGLFKSEHVKLLKKIDHKVIVWIGWGADYYKYIKPHYLSDNSLALLDKIYHNGKSRSFGMKNIFFPILKQISFLTNRSLSFYLKKVKIFCPPIMGEFQSITKLPYFTKEVLVVRWNYPYFIPKKSSLTSEINGIQIGNSQSIENNHMEIIDMLDSHDRFDSYTLVLPISYGDDKAYCEYLKSYLNKTNLKSVIIEKFLSKEEYFKIIDNVEIGIFNSIRQMAMGNIIALLASGKAVFLRKDNPFFMHLKELGVKLYSIDQLNEYDNLTKLEIDNNNFLMQTYYGFEQCRKNTQDLLEKIKTIIS